MKTAELNNSENTKKYLVSRTLQLGNIVFRRALGHYIALYKRENRNSSNFYGVILSSDDYYNSQQGILLNSKLTKEKSLTYFTGIVLIKSFPDNNFVFGQLTNKELKTIKDYVKLFKTKI
jgi:hypothetical protein